MKKLFTILAVLFTLSCSAQDTTQVSIKANTYCRKKHKSLINRGVEVDSLTMQKCKVKKAKVRKAVRRGIIFVGVWVAMFFVVKSGVLIK